MSKLSVDSLSISKIGELLIEQLGEDAADYTFPEDFEKAVVDIDFKGLVIVGESSPYDLIVIGNGLNGLPRSNNATPTAFYKTVRFVGNPDSIPFRSFFGQLQLTSIIIPDSVTYVGSDAFYGCNSITEIEFPDNVMFGTTSLNMTSLEKIRFKDGWRYESQSNSPLTVFKGTNLKTLGKGEEYDVDVTDVSDIPAGFFGYSNLVSIDMSGITASPHAFRNCSMLEEATHLQNVPSNIFDGCVLLRSVTIDSGATEIGSGAFNGCRSLETILIPDTVTHIWQDAFIGCTSLRSVTGNGVAYIGAGVNNQGRSFYNCTSLKSISFPKLQNINTTGNAYAVFGGCSALETALIGGVGYPLTVCSNVSFAGCTNSSLEITVFVEPNTASAILSNIRNGATNATIIMKAAVDMEYNGTTYQAGDTILTSTPA